MVSADPEPLTVVASFPVAPVPTDPILPIPGQVVSSVSSHQATSAPYPITTATMDPVLPIPGLIPAVALTVTIPSMSIVFLYTHCRALTVVH